MKALIDPWKPTSCIRNELFRPKVCSEQGMHWTTNRMSGHGRPAHRIGAILRACHVIIRMWHIKCFFSRISIATRARNYNRKIDVAIRSLISANLLMAFGSLKPYEHLSWGIWKLYWVLENGICWRTNLCLIMYMGCKKVMFDLQAFVPDNAFSWCETNILYTPR